MELNPPGLRGLRLWALPISLIASLFTVIRFPTLAGPRDLCFRACAGCVCVFNTLIYLTGGRSKYTATYGRLVLAAHACSCFLCAECELFGSFLWVLHVVVEIAFEYLYGCIVFQGRYVALHLFLAGAGMAAGGSVRYYNSGRHLAEQSEGEVDKIHWAVPTAIVTMVSMCLGCIVIYGARNLEEFSDRSRVWAGLAALTNFCSRIRGGLQSFFSCHVHDEVVRMGASECEVKWKDMTLRILRAQETRNEDPREASEPRTTVASEREKKSNMMKNVAQGVLRTLKLSKEGPRQEELWEPCVPAPSQMTPDISAEFANHVRSVAARERSRTITFPARRLTSTPRLEHPGRQRRRFEFDGVVNDFHPCHDRYYEALQGSLELHGIRWFKVSHAPREPPMSGRDIEKQTMIACLLTFHRLAFCRDENVVLCIIEFLFDAEGTKRQRQTNESHSDSISDGDDNSDGDIISFGGSDSAVMGSEGSEISTGSLSRLRLLLADTWNFGRLPGWDQLRRSWNEVVM
eukprot:TRINITY_DN89245_c0_g1_i1.p1 TRINITY_DN89245_c0_g1~~TRINITY_DN89245_c0_g1_i1.p1  ORF type:complete len:529 (-),score=56.26 TRINITY_DN89245_c0_g1_i1:134-1687(-)